MSMVVAGHAEGRLDLSLWPLEMVVAAKPDTVVFQRFIEDGQVDVMKAIRAALPDALLVYELDDYLGEIPAASFHAGFMPPDLPAKIARAAAVCDRVTTSTEPMAAWFRGELGHADVRVVGNAIPAAAVRPRAARTEGRLRIGFCGGISHGGDLEIIRPAMEAIGDAVDWVFFGMQPKDPPVRTEFHPGVSPSEYQARMLELDLDLVLAPLEDNRFNACKSNLRIVEAGMTGACAIAQRLTPYVGGDPPVFAYADTPQEWIAAINAFIAAPMIERQLSADALQKWVVANHTLEKRLSDRLAGWLSKDDSPLWKPGRTVGKRIEDTVVACAAEPPRCVRNAVRRDTLLEACARASSVGADVLWLRPGAALDDGSWRSVRSTMAQADTVASAVPLASDGPNSFPRMQNWTPVSAGAAADMADALREIMPGRRMIVGAPSGPCALLGARALAMLGFPDVDGCDGNEEQAVMEWGLRAAQRGWRNMQSADAYAASLVPPLQPTHRAAQRLQLRGYAQGGFAGESLSQQERADAEMAFLKVQWAGPQPGTAGFGYDYASWAALKGDLPAPDHTAASEASLSVVAFGCDWPHKDVPVMVGDKVVQTIATDSPDWVVFVDDSIRWLPNGLATLRAAVFTAPGDVAVVYADNAFRTPDGGVYPDLKPDFDQELFLARDYVTPVCAVRYDWLLGNNVKSRTDLFGLLVSIMTCDNAKFLHVPHVVAEVAESTPEELAMSAIGRQMAIEAHYGTLVTVKANPNLPGCLSVVRNWNDDGRKYERYVKGREPLVSIIIPTLGHGRLIQPCVNTIRQHTTYPNYEIIVAQNGPLAEPELGEAALADPRVRVVRWESNEGEGFNWSRLCNDIVRDHAQGSYLCFMNDDVCTGAEGWLDAMMGHAVRPDVGAVGAKLLHPAGFVQHVGVICHKGIAGHLFKGLPNGQPGNGWLAALTHEASAVTGACMLVSRERFEDVDGFDADAFPLNYGDTDFCLKLRRRYLRNVVEITAELLHPEGTSRTDPNDQAGMLAQLYRDNLRFAERWPNPDPYWHPDLSLGLTQGGAAISGLNRELLLWENRRAEKDAVRVLLVNDLPGLAGQAVKRAKVGQVVFFADLSGFDLRLIAPVPANVAGWNVRDSFAIARALKRLGIQHIVLRSLVGMHGAAAPVEALRCFAKLGINVSVEPVAPALVTPWDCEKPVDVFGSVDLDSWRRAYDDLVSPERMMVA